AFAVLLPVRTVGVMGDYRTYDYVVGLRAVTSTDGMTADFYPFDMKFIGHVATRIVNEVKGVNRVVYDVTSKPPGTIECEGFRARRGYPAISESTMQHKPRDQTRSRKQAVRAAHGAADKVRACRPRAI